VKEEDKRILKCVSTRRLYVVYAIDASDIIDQARLVVTANNLQDKIILIKGKVEDISLPEKVDVIVSEWMGYFLLYESMFESVLIARDRWLKPDGKMFPSKANLYLTIFNDDDQYNHRVEFWRNVYGINFSAIIPYAKKCAFEEPQVEFVAPQNLLAFPVKIKSFDMKTVTVDELRHLHAEFALSAIISANMMGFASWFDVVFEGTQEIFTLSTAPEYGYTHWKQTLFYFDDPLALVQDDQIEGSIDVTQHAKNKRFLNISIQFTFNRTLHFKKHFELK
jgi:protein arginine N-methyltransferase 6